MPGLGQEVRHQQRDVIGALALGQVPAPAAAPAGSPATLAVAPDDLLARPYKEARNALLADFEARYLSALLARAGGNVSRAAREARMDRSHLIDLLRRHRLRGE